MMTEIISPRPRSRERAQAALRASTAFGGGARSLELGLGEIISVIIPQILE